MTIYIFSSKGKEQYSVCNFLFTRMFFLFFTFHLFTLPLCTCSSFFLSVFVPFFLSFYFLFFPFFLPSFLSFSLSCCLFCFLFSSFLLSSFSSSSSSFCWRSFMTVLKELNHSTCLYVSAVGRNSLKGLWNYKKLEFCFQSSNIEILNYLLLAVEIIH